MQKIAHSAGGSLRDAISLLEKLAAFEEISEQNLRENLGILSTENLEIFWKFLREKKPRAAIEKVAEFLNENLTAENFIKNFLEFLRDELLKNLENQIAARDILRASKIFFAANENLPHSPLEILPVEIAIAEFCFGENLENEKQNVIPEISEGNYPESPNLKIQKNEKMKATLAKVAFEKNSANLDSQFQNEKKLCHSEFSPCHSELDSGSGNKWEIPDQVRNDRKKGIPDRVRNDKSGVRNDKLNSENKNSKNEIPSDFKSQILQKIKNPVSKIAFQNCDFKISENEILLIFANKFYFEKFENPAARDEVLKIANEIKNQNFTIKIEFRESEISAETLNEVFEIEN